MKIEGSAFVHGPQAMQGPHSVQGPHRGAAPQAAAPANSLGEVDQLDISAAGDAASRSLDAAPIRQDRVAQLRAAIEAGTYETDEKMSAALDRLLDRMG